MCNQYDMISGSVVIYKGRNFQEYEDIEQEEDNEKTDFSTLWDSICGAVPYIVDYTGGLLTGFANSFIPFDFFDYSERSEAFRAGLRGGDIIGAGVGMALVDVGTGGMAFGTVLVCTGAGAPVGVAIDAGAGLAMGFGGLMLFNSGRHTTDLGRYKGSNTSGSSGNGGNKPQKEVTIKYKNYKKDPDEFKRQLKAQEDGINKLNAGDIKANIEAYKQNGRPKIADEAARKAHQNNPNEKGNAALHNPDGVIGGRSDITTDFGKSNVNSSLGSQNRFRQSDIYDAVKDVPVNSKVKFKFEIEE